MLQSWHATRAGRRTRPAGRLAGTPALLRQKAAYIRRLGLGGTAMWSLDGDDAQGSLTAAITSVLR